MGFSFFPTIISTIHSKVVPRESRKEKNCWWNGRHRSHPIQPLPYRLNGIWIFQPFSALPRQAVPLAVRISDEYETNLFLISMLLAIYAQATFGFIRTSHFQYARASSRDCRLIFFQKCGPCKILHEMKDHNAHTYCIKISYDLFFLGCIKFGRYR